MKRFFYLVIPAILLYACNPGSENGPVEQWKQEIVNTEHDFAAMAGEVGIEEAFLHFAAQEAVLMRNNTVVKGKESIREFFQNQQLPYSDISLEWAPDFVDVSASGDLGYTYGQFVFSFTDSTGNTVENTGIFHTVWKRQPDGTWRYVWD